MTHFSKSMSLLVVILNLVTAHDPLKQYISNSLQREAKPKTAHISPELISELKDFENLIPKSTVDEIVAEHFMFDGNFRTVLKYLRSEEFAQLQKQLLTVPEIVDVLEFLHLTAENATTMHMGATKTATTAARRVAASLDEYNDAVYASRRIDKMTTINTGSKLTKPHAVAFDDVKEEAVAAAKVPKRPQKLFYIKEKNNKIVGSEEHDIDDDDDAGTDNVNANSIAFSERQQPLVHIVLLEDLEVKANVSNTGQHQQQQPQQQQHNHHHKYKTQQRYNGYHHGPLGTFTSFVAEVLQHLPNSAYQKMIAGKCQNNLQFAKFYHALRSPAFKPYIEETKSKPNIQRIITTLKSHGLDVNSLEAIAFELISWGPNL